jgi:RNase P subunit RPR2
VVICLSYKCLGCPGTVVFQQRAFATKVRWLCNDCGTDNRFTVPGHSEEESPW